MGHGHEFGQSRAAKQRVVRAADVDHLELDKLTVAVALLPEQHFQLNPSHGGA
jgi:hypothetical protein